ncbi:MAG: hypothetical protein OEY62_09640 [Acidimicrobiia bacterium]|nr:hypothetical protein [Acidimicrobiia bacterium]
MKTNLVKRTAAGATISAMLMAMPGTAFAQTEPVDSTVTETDRSATLDGLKRRALETIDTRLDAIDRWTHRVETNEHLSDDHRSVLIAELNAAAGGLRSLAADIEAATTYSELGGLIPKIVEGYWVFALLGPKVHLVIAANVMADINDRFDEVAASTQEAIERVEAAGYDPVDARAALDRMLAHLTAASTLIDQVPGSVLHLRPADMPEAGEQLRSAQADLKSAAEELRAAQQAGRQAVEAIKDAIHR